MRPDEPRHSGLEPRPRTCALVTFGCKVNQYETQILRERLCALGLTEVSPKESPDLLVVNTCTVTSRAGAQSRRYARSAAARNPLTRVVVTGCHVDSDPEDYEDLGIHLVAGNAAKGDLAGLLGLVEPTGDTDSFHEATVRHAGARTRATVKVQDGCDAGCAYCIIPSVRPDLVSKSPDRAVDEVRGLVSAGYREVVLTGIHLGAYRRERGEADALAGLVARLLDETDVARLRLSSIEVGEVSPLLLSLMRERRDRFAPHLHLPLQSGDDAVLSRMRRRYRIADYMACVERVREVVDDPAITTDVIVGFPGETEAEFETTAKLCERAGFLKIHVFPYSDRRGTRASSLPDKVHGVTMRERVGRLDEIGAAGGRAFRERFLGRVVPVLVERRPRRENGRLTGLTDRYVRVDLAPMDGAMTETDRLMNTIVPVLIEDLGPDRAYGRPTA
jgi:threonylcarbamoyladenosine tRNA methylthiotransferase MtaB